MVGDALLQCAMCVSCVT